MPPLLVHHPGHLLFLHIASVNSKEIINPGAALKIVSEHDQEIPQSQTADNPVAPQEEPHNHHETPGRQIKKSNQISIPHQDDCNTRMDIK